MFVSSLLSALIRAREHVENQSLAQLWNKWRPGTHSQDRAPERNKH